MTDSVADSLRELRDRLAMRENLYSIEVDAESPPQSERFADLQRHEASLHHRFGNFGREIRVMRRGWRGKIELFIKRILRSLLGWYARPQLEFNTSVMMTLVECVKHIETLATEVSTLRAENEARRRQASEVSDYASTSSIR